MTEQFDEGVKEILLVLLNLGAGVYEANYLLSLLNDRPEPIEQKIEGLRQAEDEIDNQKFDAAANQAIQKLSQQKKNSASNSYIDIAVKLIIPSEIHGNNMSAPENKRFHSPYLDDKGLWTVGIGHLIGDGSTASKNAWVAKNGNTLTTNQVMALFKQDVQKHAKKAESIIGSDVFRKLSPHRKAVLVDIAYRGDLKPGFDFVKLIRKGKFDSAALAYLDHTEYKTRKQQGGADGVVKRMNRNANILKGKV
jgi:GH24 family phage-related lysozyme (muramidase)